MMKRIMACLVVIVCLLTSFAFAEGDSMKVVNVNTAVNMRKGPSTDTAAITQVPVGTVVTDCVKEEKKSADGYYWYSVNYDGVTGYIRSDKLEAVEAKTEKADKKSEEKTEEKSEEKTEDKSEKKSEKKTEDKSEKKSEDKSEKKSEDKSKKKSEDKSDKGSKDEKKSATAEGEPLVAEGEPLVPEGQAEKAAAPSVLEDNVENAPVSSITEATEYDDDFVILDESVAGIRVIGRQIYQQNNEYLMAVGLDASGAEVWKKETTTDGITELMQTDIFIGGTADKPQVLMYNACRGLTAIDPTTGDVIWELAKKTLDLGASISRKVDSNGVAYIGGYYGPDPVAIDTNGNVLWKSDSGSEQATWLYNIELRDDGIACAYANMAGENTGTIVYSTKDGSIVEIIYD